MQKNIACCSRLTTARDRTIESHSLSNNYYVIAPTDPTYYAYNPLIQADILDILLYKSSAVPLEIKVPVNL